MSRWSKLLRGTALALATSAASAQDSSSTDETRREAEIDRLVRELERLVPPPSRGTSFIAGRVVDEEGRPQAGVPLVLSEKVAPAAHTHHRPVRPSLPERLVGVIEAHRSTEDRRTQSGKDGSFRFEGLPEGTAFYVTTREGPYQLHHDGCHPRYCPSGIEDAVVAVERLWPVEISVLVNGQLAPTARISMNGSSFGRPWSPEVNSLYLRPGPTRIQAQARYELDPHSGLEEWLAASAEVEIDVQAGPNETVVLHALGRQACFIRLERPAGERWGYPSVWLGSLDEELPARRGAGWVSATRGAVWILGREPGRYRVLVDRVGQPVSLGEVDLGPGTTRLSLEVPPVDPRRLVPVASVAPDGTPLRDVHYFLDARGVPGVSYGSVRMLEWVDGTRCVVLDSKQTEAREAGRPMHLAAQSATFGSRVLPLPPEGPLRFEFEAPAEVVFRLRGAMRHVDRVLVSLTQPGSSLTELKEPIDAPQRELRLQIQPGIYQSRIVLQSIEDGQPRSLLTTEGPEVQALPGESSPIDWKLPQLSRITVRVLHDVPGASVLLLDDARRQLQRPARLDARQVAFDPVVNGVYEVVLQDPRGPDQRQRVLLTEDCEITFAR